MKNTRNFPTVITETDAQKLINSTNSYGILRDELIKEWAKAIVDPKQKVYVSYEIYKRLRSSTFSIESRSLLDEIFGMDVDISDAKFEKYTHVSFGNWNTLQQVGIIKDIEICSTNKLIYIVECRDDSRKKEVEYIKNELDKNNQESSDISETVTYRLTESNLEIPTMQEFESISNKKSPYKDGELCWVSERDNEYLILRYASGDISDNGQPLFYKSQFDLDKSKVNTYPYHRVAKGVKLSQF